MFSILPGGPGANTRARTAGANFIPGGQEEFKAKPHSSFMVLRAHVGEGSIWELFCKIGV